MAPSSTGTTRASSVRYRSRTPADQGALAVLEQVLGGLGFRCERLKFSAPGTPDVENLYARWGAGPIGQNEGPNFCFAGHTDVVPVGDEKAWTVPPFGAEIIDGQLYGRGAADMKSAIAAFVAAAARFLQGRDGRLNGGISLLITGDEEGPAINGTTKVLQWLAQKGEKLSVCVVGEPTNPLRLGQMMKVVACVQHVMGDAALLEEIRQQFGFRREMRCEQRKGLTGDRQVWIFHPMIIPLPGLNRKRHRLCNVSFRLPAVHPVPFGDHRGVTARIAAALYHVIAVIHRAGHADMVGQNPQAAPCRMGREIHRKSCPASNAPCGGNRNLMPFPGIRRRMAAFPGFRLCLCDRPERWR